MNKMWTQFEQELSAIDKKIYLWWRDDDIRAQTLKFGKLRSIFQYRNKVKTLVKLFKKHKIPAVFAIIPENYRRDGLWFTDLFKKYHIKVILHGLVHQNFAAAGFAKSEFPNESTASEDYNKIMSYYHEFKSEFGTLLLPYFCPPYNNINAQLEATLNHAGLKISKANFSTISPQTYNIDYDFCDWTVDKIKPYQQILGELLALFKSEKKVIGINGHHVCLHASRGDFKFFDQLFTILARYPNIQWFCPLKEKQ